MALWQAAGRPRDLTGIRMEIEGDGTRVSLACGSARFSLQTMPVEDLAVGLRMCAELSWVWEDRGSLAEGQRWLERAVALAGDEDSPELADCLKGLGVLRRALGSLPRSQAAAAQSVAMWRRLGDKPGLLDALLRLGAPVSLMGDVPRHREILEEALILARSLGDNYRLSRALSDLASLAVVEHNLERSLQLNREAVRIAGAEGDEVNPLKDRHSIACTLREMGRFEEASSEMRDLIPSIVRLGNPEWLVLLAEDYAAVLAEVGHPERAARLLGAAEGGRENQSPAQCQTGGRDRGADRQSASGPFGRRLGPPLSPRA